MKNETIWVNGLEVRKSTKYWNYGTSECGKVFRWATKKEMSVSLTGDASKNNQYLRFRSCHNNKPKNARVNIIVADCWCFNDDPVNKVEVNHKDGNKLNNHASNLEHTTKSQNQRHAIDTGLKGKGEQLYNSSMSNDVAHLVCQHLQDGWAIKSIADKFDLPKDNIRKLKAGDTYFHIRVLYNIQHDYRSTLSDETVRWVCEGILKGMSDSQLVNKSTNSSLTRIECKRIRYKIRYKIVSDEYF